MLQQFEPGDFLIFQLESGYALLRVVAIEGPTDDPVWHLASFNELFMDVDSAEAAIQTPGALTVDKPHIALTNHAFERTQVAKLGNAPVLEVDLDALAKWKSDPHSQIHDRSVRLVLGLR
jgi:hypothetical protein